MAAEDLERETCAFAGDILPDSEPDPVLERELEVALGKSFTARAREVVVSHRWTFASLSAHVLMLSCFALMPPSSSALALDMLSEDARYARYLATPTEQDAPEWLQNQTLSQAAGGAAAAGDQGAAGTPDSTVKQRRASGGSARHQPSMSRDLPAEARRAGILGVLAASPALLGGDQFSDANGFGYGSETALGALLGDQIGDSSGFHGLGMRGTGRGGGGDALGTIGVGKIGTSLGHGPGGFGSGHALANRPRESRVPTARSGPVEVRGSLSKETIRRTIQRHLNEVRFCYEQALTQRPELAGRVEVLFMIAPSGAVQKADVAESSMQHAGLESCVSGAVRRWSFPAPDGGGYVMVRYPFVLEQSGNAP